MQSKSTRGVQQEEVWAAADALIAAGERPTIERVRLKIGRGSPNTVSPMLEAWFATLAPRLGVAASGAPPAQNGAPQALRQALDAVWAGAVTAAREKAEAALATEHDRLAQQGLELDSQRQRLLEREATLAERGVALEQALELAKSQLRDQAARLEKAGRDLEQARNSLATLVQERDADRRQFDEQLRTLAEERQRIEQRASANERRLLEEVDRARQEAKQSARALEDAGQKHTAETQALERTNAALGNRVHEGQIELATLRERLQGAEERVKGLESALAAATPETRRTKKSRTAKLPTSGRRGAGMA
ncbi:MAG: DNA-binding protein [Pandoraea sp.]|uniref:DNA-binding protein n=1 Tax=Pandoraea sp. TaxID=1883445 RepID=UPI001200CC6F|nr:DNA-binding protein [Pandoraea sp.]TAM14061.1 MAG: DNA-binding protein [Pandoraea sp.]